MAKIIVLIMVSICITLSAGINSNAAEDHPCAEEIGKFCTKVKPGEGRIVVCLKEHEKELSPACKEKFKETEQRLKECQEACCDDVKKFCSDVRPGGGRIARCLKEHTNELSALCKEKIVGP